MDKQDTAHLPLEEMLQSTELSTNTIYSILHRMRLLPMRIVIDLLDTIPPNQRSVFINALATISDEDTVTFALAQSVSVALRHREYENWRASTKRKIMLVAITLLTIIFLFLMR